MDTDSLESRIASFDESRYRWVDFSKLGDFDEPDYSPDRLIRNALRANRHEQRYRYFFERLLQLTGGSLRGHKVLDLGCNGGFWSLKAAQAGADFVLGIDGRAANIDHAKLAFEAEGVSPDRFRFEVANLFEFPFMAADSAYDVVLCLGLLYHVAKPVELFEVMRKAGAEIIVIDTEVSLASGSMLQVASESLDEVTNAVDYEVVFYPTRQAVADIAAQFGYQTVPLALNITDWRNMDNYRNGSRVAFICARSIPLEGLPREAPRPFGAEQDAPAAKGLRRQAHELASELVTRTRHALAKGRKSATKSGG
jgi:tRNA (mo5U34)-methyltransferase